MTSVTKIRSTCFSLIIFLPLHFIHITSLPAGLLRQSHDRRTSTAFASSHLGLFGCTVTTELGEDHLLQHTLRDTISEFVREKRTNYAVQLHESHNNGKSNRESNDEDPSTRAAQPETCSTIIFHKTARLECCIRGNGAFRVVRNGLSIEASHPAWTRRKLRLYFTQCCHRSKQSDTNRKAEDCG